jgi:hypothetical protein
MLAIFPKLKKLLTFQNGFLANGTDLSFDEIPKALKL